MTLRHFVIFLLLLIQVSCSAQQTSVLTGADQPERYLPLLRNKRVGLVVNQTSVHGTQHLVDFLLARQIQVVTVFAPEHGFRGTAEAGETVRDGVDVSTGLKIVSLYGKDKKPSPEQLASLDILVFDIQDVGTRFYTYISTMHYVMEACAEQHKPLVVLDRPNPNSDYVDGPVLEPRWSSFVGLHPIPVVHGLTVGELARMINGEGWLTDKITCELHVIPVLNWKRGDPWGLKIAPSPNLPNDQSVRLYPSLCFFEGTALSLGRGTPYPFQVVGSPELTGMNFSFTPISIPGVANHPPHENQKCFGLDLRKESPQPKIRLDLLLQLYQSFPTKDKFFIPYFERLAGTESLRQQIMSGKSEVEIRASWKVGLEDFLKRRKPYLLY